MEYLLFECLQDLTGGALVFTLATKCFIVDITSDKNRTARLAVTDAFLGIGYLTGITLGTRLKNSFGYNTLFSVGLALCVIGLLYSVIILNDSYHLVSEEKKSIFDKQREKNAVKCDQGIL